MYATYGTDTRRQTIYLLSAGDGVPQGPQAPAVREVVCLEPNASFHAKLREAMADARARAEAAQPLGWITKPVTSSALLRSLEQIDWPDGGQA